MCPLPPPNSPLGRAEPPGSRWDRAPLSLRPPAAWNNRLALMLFSVWLEKMGVL